MPLQMTLTTGVDEFAVRLLVTARSAATREASSTAIASILLSCQSNRLLFSHEFIFAQIFVPIKRIQAPNALFKY
jgi:hypothetical protein